MIERRDSSKRALLSSSSPSDGPSSYGGADAAAARALWPVWLFGLQVLAVGCYCTLSLVLPLQEGAVFEASHVAALHAVLFVIVVALWGGIRTADLRCAPPGYPLTPRLAEVPGFVCVCANAVLLACLGLETLLQSLTSHEDFSVLNIVQALAIAELVLVLVAAVVCAWRLVRFRAAVAAGEVVGVGSAGGVAAPRRASIVPFFGPSSGDQPVLDGSEGAAALRSPHVQRLVDRVSHLEGKEQELLLQLRRVASELAAALVGDSSASAGASGGDASSPSALGALVQTLTAQLARDAAVLSDTAARAALLEERTLWYESELKRASSDVQRLRSSLKEEKRRGEKLYATLDLEREANAQAQAAIADLRGRLAPADPSAAAGAAAPGGTALGLGGGSFSGPSASHMLQRSASLAGRASFAAMASPGPQRTLSRSGASSTALLGSPLGAAVRSEHYGAAGGGSPMSP